MSNQIAENQARKYYLQNGINLYEVVQEQIAPNVTKTLGWLNQIVDCPGIVQIINNSEEFTPYREGIYTFTFFFNMTAGVTPESIDLEPFISVILHNSHGDLLLTAYHSRIVAHGANVGGTDRIIPINCTTWMNLGDTLRVTVDTLSGDAIELQYSACSIIGF